MTDSDWYERLGPEDWAALEERARLQRQPNSALKIAQLDQQYGFVVPNGKRGNSVDFEEAIETLESRKRQLENQLEDVEAKLRQLREHAEAVAEHEQAAARMMDDQ